MDVTPKSIFFRVIRTAPELISPANPTPRELKHLSDIDDQEGFRLQVPSMHFYRKSHLGRGRDPVRVIRDALARALVYYYPLAGRLVEVGRNGKLAVDCNFEGVLFVGADADADVDDFGDVLVPPFPCFDEPLYSVTGSVGVIGCPLLLVQVTRFRCGAFAVAVKMNHTVCDASAIVQFLRAVGEMARGASAPSIPPVWRRELLNASDPPRVTCVHREFHPSPAAPMEEEEGLVARSFFFGSAELAALRRLMVPQSRKCTSFELLASVLWRIRTKAIDPDADEEVRLILSMSARNKFDPPLPSGYYGNLIAHPVAIAKARSLIEDPIEDTLKLIRKTKDTVTEDFMRSTADLMVLTGRPHFTVTRTTWGVSDVTRVGCENVDFGWGKPAYAGPGVGGIGHVSFMLQAVNKNGERGIVVPVYLTQPAMDRFSKELNGLLEPSLVRSAM